MIEMGLTPKTATLFLILIFFASFYSLYVASASSLEKLEWIDTGKVVRPGVKFTVQFHSEGSRLLGGLADAGIQIGSLIFGIGECGTWWDPHVCLVMGGHVHDLGSLPWGKYQYDASMEFTVYCNGTMIVEATNYGYTHEYFIGVREVPILYFSESNPALSSSVFVGRVEVFSSCLPPGATTTWSGTLPTTSEGSVGGALPGPDWKMLLLVVGVGLILLFVLLVVTLVVSAIRR